MSNALTEFILKENAKAEARARIEERMNLKHSTLELYQS